MPVLADLTDALIALIPEDGSRITNDQIRVALEQEVSEPLSDAELKEIKNLVVAMGVAEGVKGPGGGLKAPGLDPPPQATIAPGTTAASVLTGELSNQIDRIWDAFWSGGIANPLEVLEQLTYLLFIRRLDELETLEERRSQRAEQPMRRRIFSEGADEQGRPWSELRWSRFKELGEAASISPRRGCSPRWWSCSMRCRWRTATPRETSMSTCSASWPPPAPTASSAHRATSSS
jgi:hypothetical protein